MEQKKIFFLTRSACVYVCTYVSKCICMYVYTYMCVYTCICACIHVYVWVFVSLYLLFHDYDGNLSYPRLTFMKTSVAIPLTRDK